MGRVAQRFVERLAHHRAVRQAGQRIEPGEARDLALGLALLGQVGADAAESEEAAAIVEDRVAGQRPVDVLLARRADDHIGEGKARGQMEAERLALLGRVRRVVDREEVGELAPEQRLAARTGSPRRAASKHRTGCRAESVSQNQPRPLFSNSSTKFSAFCACHSTREPAAARANSDSRVLATL